MRTIEDMGLESAHVKRSTNTHHFHEYFFSQFDCIWLYIRIPVNPDEFKWAIFPMQRSIFGPKSRTWRCSFAACAGESVWQILCALVLVVYHLVIKHGLELPHLYQMFHWFLEGSCFFLPSKKGFTYRRSAFGTDSGDSYGQPRSWKIHLGRRLTCWKVGDRCGDPFLIGKNRGLKISMSPFLFLYDIWYLLISVKTLWCLIYLWKHPPFSSLVQGF